MKLTLEQFETQFADNNLSVTDWFDTTYGLFKELEALQQPKSCDGCKYQMHTINDVQSHGNWMRYSVFYDCVNDKSCKRKSIDRYEPKEQ